VAPGRETKEATSPAPRVGQILEDRNTRATRSNSIHGIGTIVRKWFHNRKYYEGEVIDYDTINKYYKIKFKDGDQEDFDEKDIKQYYKQNQQYSGTKYRNKARAFRTHKYDQNFDYSLVPTPKQAPIHQALSASGCVWDEELHKMAHYRELIVHPNPVIQQRWMGAAENEFGRLFQGFGDVEGMDVLEWIEKDLVPLSKVVTYARFTAAERAEKAERYRCRITGGGDRLTYEGDVSTKTAALETFKLLLNSVISTAGAKMCTGDISNMYLYNIPNMQP
jgi:hypothetical protein